MATLLEKAKSYDKRNPRTAIKAEEIELALAWLKGEITMSQASAATGLKKPSGTILYRLSLCLREAYKQGIIQLK